MIEQEKKTEKYNNHKWLFSPPAIIVAFLIVGPLAIILVFLSPSFNKKTKIFWAIIMIIISIFFAIVTIRAAKEIIGYYKIVFGETTF